MRDRGFDSPMRELGSVDTFFEVSEEGCLAWKAAHKVETYGSSRSLMFR